MHDIEVLLMLLIAVVALVASAKRLKIPYPILLVLGGLLLGFVPGLPPVKLNPDIVFLLFLPPLLQAEAWFFSWRDFRRNVRPIVLLAVGLVLFTTVTVALVAHLLLPGFPLAAALVLGAIAAPTDAVAVSALGGRLQIPRRILVVLSGESLVNDASALVMYRAAVAAVVTGTFSLSAAGMSFVLASLGGIVIGLVVGYVLALVLERTDDPILGIVISLLAPFIAYLPSERLHVSGVLATVSAGLYLGRQAAHVFTPKQRTQGLAFWQVLVFLLNGILFILVGLQLRTILADLSTRSVPTLFYYASVICLTVVLTRFLWVFPATYLPRLLSSRLRRKDPAPPWQHVVIISWSGARGGVSLASALAVPLVTATGMPFPQREMILFLTFSVIFATLVVQGLTLPFLIRHLHLREDGTPHNEERQARVAATQAALQRLDQLAAESGVATDIIERLHGYYSARLADLDPGVDSAGRQRHTEFGQEYHQLKKQLLAAEREIVVGLRDQGDLNDDALNRIQHDLDLDELRLEPGGTE